mmetsp:Transcript_34598/g.83721  ORF Transcript_34598/g.83721 Transcript_34598/m.83721 type:complete len:204 (+) Transcript_34598:150-761(+)
MISRDRDPLGQADPHACAVAIGISRPHVGPGGRERLSSPIKDDHPRRFWVRHVDSVPPFPSLAFGFLLLLVTLLGGHSLAARSLDAVSTNANERRTPQPWHSRLPAHLHLPLHPLRRLMVLIFYRLFVLLCLAFRLRFASRNHRNDLRISLRILPAVQVHVLMAVAEAEVELPEAALSRPTCLRLRLRRESIGSRPACSCWRR